MSLRLAYMTGEYFRVSHTFVRREAAMLRQMGHHVQAISIRRPAEGENPGGEMDAERKEAIFLLPAGPIGLLAAHLGQLFRSPGKYFSAMALAWRTRASFFRAMAYFAEAGLLARSMRREKLTHLHNHFSSSSCSVAMIGAEMGGFTFSFTVHGPAELYEPKLWRLDEKVVRASFVNCISYFCRSQVMVFASPDQWHKLRIVHCGVDPAKFSPRVHEGTGKQLLFAGRLAAAKGLPVLLEAMKLLPDESLSIAGDGPDRRMLEAMAASLGVKDRVRFLGYQSQREIVELLKQTDAFVMTSFAEGVPVVLMEAMAAGVPVVATRIAGIPELVADGESGLLVAPGDSAATAQAIRRLLEDTELRNRMAQRGRAMVEKEFNIELEGKWLNKILTEQPAGVRP